VFTGVDWLWVFFVGILRIFGEWSVQRREMGWDRVREGKEEGKDEGIFILNSVTCVLTLCCIFFQLGDGAGTRSSSDPQHHHGSHWRSDAKWPTAAFACVSVHCPELELDLVLQSYRRPLYYCSRCAAVI
jgi:hypothetical protein